MAVFRVERTKDYTVMSNHHLKDTGLTLKSKGLLSMILSLPDDWNYTTRGLAAICKEGVDAIGAALKELETAGYIVRTQLRDARGRISDTEYVIYEQPRRPDTPPPDTPPPDTPPPDTPPPDTAPPDTAPPDTAPPDTENPDMDEPDMDGPDTDGPDTDGPDTEKPAQLNTKVFNTQKSITHPSNTHSFVPSATDGLTDVFEKREEIRDQIEYGHICDITNREQIDEFVEIMLEVALTRSPTVKIGRDAEYPAAFVRERFERITSEHIEKVLDGIRENTTRVWNTKAYLLAALFNAPSSTDNHYTMLVNHDFHGG